MDNLDRLSLAGFPGLRGNGAWERHAGPVATSATAKTRSRPVNSIKLKSLREAATWTPLEPY